MPSIGQVRDGARRGSMSAIRSMAASFQCLPHDLKSPKPITYPSPHHRIERTYKCWESLATHAESRRELLRPWAVPTQPYATDLPEAEDLPQTYCLDDDAGPVDHLTRPP